MIGSSLRWICIVLLSTVVVSCRAPSKAWNGTWRLNVPKSRVPGPDFSITVSTTGEYHFDNGTHNYNFRCDGKGYPTNTGRTISCIQTSSVEMDTTSLENSGKTAIAHWELSPNQQTLVIDSTRVQPAATAKSQKNVYVRTSGTTGFTGGWTNPRRLKSRPQVMVLTLKEHSLRLAFPEKEQYTDLSLDGTDSVVHDAEPTPGATIAIHPNGPREFLTTTKSGGHIVSQGFLTLSADGRTLTEVYWRPEMPHEKAVLVYQRQ
jgi:hypothetical protein